MIGKASYKIAIDLFFLNLRVQSFQPLPEINPLSEVESEKVCQNSAGEGMFFHRHFYQASRLTQEVGVSGVWVDRGVVCEFEHGDVGCMPCSCVLCVDEDFMGLEEPERATN